MSFILGHEQKTAKRFETSGSSLIATLLNTTRKLALIGIGQPAQSLQSIDLPALRVAVFGEYCETAIAVKHRSKRKNVISKFEITVKLWLYEP